MEKGQRGFIKLISMNYTRPSYHQRQQSVIFVFFYWSEVLIRPVLVKLRKKRKLLWISEKFVSGLKRKKKKKEKRKCGPVCQCWVFLSKGYGRSYPVSPPRPVSPNIPSHHSHTSSKLIQLQNSTRSLKGTL